MPQPLNSDQKSKVNVYLHNLKEILTDAEANGVDISLLMNAAFAQVVLNGRGSMYHFENNSVANTVSTEG